MVSIFPNLCLWRRSLHSNVGGIDPEKQYRATLICIILFFRSPRVALKEDRRPLAVYHPFAEEIPDILM